MASEKSLRAAEAIKSQGWLSSDAQQDPHAISYIAALIDSEMGVTPEPEYHCPSCNHRVTGLGLCPECRTEYLEKVHRGMAGRRGGA